MYSHRSEPWIALSPVFALREEGVAADYDSRLAQRALKEFLHHLPEGDAAYADAVRLMLSHLYNRSLAVSGKALFLDKTPRYYFIIPELRRLFPEAKFVFLLRNPLAVLASILETWVKSEDIGLLRNHWHDLLTAPQRLLEGIRSFAPNAIVVRYEELASEPETVIRRLCERLDVSFFPGMIEYGSAPDRTPWLFGDQGTALTQSRPIPGRLERWREVLKARATWQSWGAAYLARLGPDVVSELGYDYGSLRASLPENGGCSDWMEQDPGTGDHDSTAVGTGSPRGTDAALEQQRSEVVIGHLRQHLDVQTAAADERLVALREKDEALGRLGAELSARDSVIEKFEQHAKTLGATAAERLAALQEKEGALDRLTAELIVRQTVIDELGRQVTALDTAAAERLAALQEKEGALDRLTAELIARQTVIDQLGRQVKVFADAAAERLIALQEKEEALDHMSAELIARQTVIDQLGRRMNAFEASAAERLNALQEKEKAP